MAGTYSDQTSAYSNLWCLIGKKRVPLKGFDPKRYTVHLNEPWIMTFEFRDRNAYRVDLEQYH